ncbi:MAG TPA: hypothetical protein VKF41_08975 [Bryobacteraceae bacterium]|nr:hypothetical protein [Bryobacteraceae bacterium]
MAAATSADSGFDSYTNGRFGFAVQYPKRLLLAQGESFNGDGQRFESKDKKFKLAVWGGYNVFDRTVAEECDWHIEIKRKAAPLTVTYKVSKGNWYVFSGVTAGLIVYQKGILQDGAFKTLYLEYPQSDKDALDPVVKRIIGSFSSIRAEAP